MPLPPTRARSAPTRRLGRKPAGALNASGAKSGTSPEETRQQLQEALLAQVSQSGTLCSELERELSRNPPPELETLIALHRVLVLKLSLEANVSPAVFRALGDLMKPVMEWARLQEKRKDRELAERKHRDSVEARKAAAGERREGDALTPETLQKIQSELKLF